MKEYDIRPREAFQRYLRLSQKDARAFFRNHTRFEKISCIGCGGKKLAVSIRKNGFQYMECRACASLFVSPRPSPALLDSFYANSPSGNYWAEIFFPSVAEARRKKIFAPRVTRIKKMLRERSFSPRVIVEVGAGHGIFLEECRKQFAGVSVRAVEPNVKQAAICRAKKIDTLERPIEKAEAWSEIADFVCCCEVIEHVYSPRAFLKAIAAIVKPGGYMLVTGLGIDGFDIQTLWEKSQSIFPPHHLNFLSVRALQTLAKGLGLTDIQITTPGQLDLDIVRNEWSTQPAVLHAQRFLQVLLTRRGPAAHADFQQFLINHRLSSHMWLLARKPLRRKK